MKFFVKAAVVAAAFAASAAAHASSFDFSYDFADGQQVITGSFDGTSSDGGQSISNISNLQLFFNGVAFSGGASSSLILNGWNPNGTTTSTDPISGQTTTTPGAWVAPGATTTIFANGALNNFVISDVDASVSTSPTYEFAFVNNNVGGAQATAFNFLSSDAFGDASGLGIQLDTDGANGTWHVSAVPLPETLPLLGSALGALGSLGVFRRRRNGVTA